MIIRHRQLRFDQLEQRLALTTSLALTHVIDSSELLTTWLEAEDFDEDQDRDLVALRIVFTPGESDEIEVQFLENSNGGLDFEESRVIDRQNEQLYRSVVATDFDLDGDTDLLMATKNGWNSITLHESVEGSLFAGTPAVLASPVEAVGAFFAFDVDLDQDGDDDVLTWSNDIGGRISWHENLGARELSEERLIVSSGFLPELIKPGVVGAVGNVPAVADIDGDGDLDIINELAWHENDGDQEFTRHEISDRDRAWALRELGSFVEDFDDDGDPDLIVPQSTGQIEWQENLDGIGSFGPPVQVGWIQEEQIREILFLDIDRDGDTDLLLATKDGSLILYESNNEFTRKPLLHRDGHDINAVHAADMDSDGDVDLVIGWDDSITIQENRLVGDVNDDGEVSFSDLTLLAANFGGSEATWEEGDLDLDGVVGFTDFLVLSDGFGTTRDVG